MKNIARKYRKRMIERLKNKSKKMVFAAGSSLMLASCALGDNNNKGKIKTNTMENPANNSDSISNNDIKTDSGRVKKFAYKPIIAPLVSIGKTKYNMTLLFDYLNSEKTTINTANEKENLYIYVKNVVYSFRDTGYLQKIDSNDISKDDPKLVGSIKSLLRKAPKDIVKRLRKEFIDDINKDVKLLKRKNILSLTWNLIFTPMALFAMVGLLASVFTGGAYLLFGLPFIVYIILQTISLAAMPRNPFADNSYVRKDIENQRDAMGAILQKIIDEKQGKEENSYADWANDLKSLQNYTFKGDIL